MEPGLQIEMEAPLLPRPSNAPVPLAGSQQRAWNYVTKSGAQSVGKLATAVRVSGALDTGLLQQSIDQVTQRHESLRTRICVFDQKPRQQIDRAGTCRLELLDLSRVPSGAAEARRLAEEFAEAETAWSTGPLFRAAVLRLAEYEHVLVLATDHIVSDAMSSALVSREVWSLYDRGTRGLRLELPQPQAQFADYAVWQQQTEQAWRRRHEAYWREHLAVMKPTRLPVESNISSVAQRTSASLNMPLGKKLSVALRELAQRAEVSLPTAMLAVHACALSQWCDQRDLSLIFVTHGRHFHPQLRDMIGFFASCLYLHVDVAAAGTALDLMKQVRTELDAAFTHYDFDRATTLVPECAATEVGFNWVSAALLRPSTPEPSRMDRLIRLQPFPLRLSWLDKLLLFFSDTPAGIVASATYRPDLFSRGTVERFGQRLRLISQAFVERPSTAVTSLLQQVGS